MNRTARPRLSLGYRLWYRMRYIGLSIFGPAQLGESNDPLNQLRRERADRLASAQGRPRG